MSKLIISVSARAVNQDTIQSLTAQKKDLEKQLSLIDSKLNKLNEVSLKAMLPSKGYYQISKKTVALDGPTKTVKSIVQVTSASLESIRAVYSHGAKTTFSAREWTMLKAKPVTKEVFEAAIPVAAPTPKIKVSAAARAATSHYEFALTIGEFLSKKRFVKIEQAIQQAATSKRATVVALTSNRRSPVGTWNHVEGFKWANQATRKKFTGS